MGLDFTTVKELFPQAVPMVGTLNLALTALTEQSATMTLPDQAAYHNHIGGPHAGAMFTLAESASGALVLGNFGDLLDRVTPLAANASIAYQRLAMGDVTAVATMDRDPAQVLAELEQGVRPEFTVLVKLSTNDGTQTGEMTIQWTLRPNK